MESQGEYWIGWGISWVVVQATFRTTGVRGGVSFWAWSDVSWREGWRHGSEQTWAEGVQACPGGRVLSARGGGQAGSRSGQWGHR